MTDIIDPNPLNSEGQIPVDLSQDEPPAIQSDETSPVQSKDPWYTDIGKGILTGAAKGVMATGELINRVQGFILDPAGTDEGPLGQAAAERLGQAAHKRLEEPNALIPTGPAGKTIEPIVQFGVGLALSGIGTAGEVAQGPSILKAGSNLLKGQAVKESLVGLGKAGLQGTEAQVAAFPGDAPNSIDAIQSVLGSSPQFQQYLETNPQLRGAMVDYFADREDQPELIKRLQKTLEDLPLNFTGGIVLGGAGEAAVGAVKNSTSIRALMDIFELQKAKVYGKLSMTQDQYRQAMATQLDDLTETQSPFSEVNKSLDILFPGDKKHSGEYNLGNLGQVEDLSAIRDLPNKVEGDTLVSGVSKDVPLSQESAQAVPSKPLSEPVLSEEEKTTVFKHIQQAKEHQAKADRSPLTEDDNIFLNNKATELYTSGSKSVRQDKHAHFVVGATGHGKSEFLKQFTDEGFFKFSPDEVVKSLPGYDLNNPATYDLVNNNKFSASLLESLDNRLLENGDNVIYEGTLISPEAIKRLRDKGYKITATFVEAPEGVVQRRLFDRNNQPGQHIMDPETAFHTSKVAKEQFNKIVGELDGYEIRSTHTGGDASNQSLREAPTEYASEVRFTGGGDNLPDALRGRTVPDNQATRPDTGADRQLLTPEQSDAAGKLADRIVENLNGHEDKIPVDISHVLNTNTFNSPEETRAVVQALIEATGSVLVKKERVSWEYLNENADKMFTDTVSGIADLVGIDSYNLASLLKKDSIDLRKAAVRATMTKTVIESLLQQAARIAEDAKTSTFDLTGNGETQLWNIRQVLIELADPYAKFRSETGRTLRSFANKPNSTQDVTELLSASTTEKVLPRATTPEEAAKQALLQDYEDGMSLVNLVNTALDNYKKGKVLTAFFDKGYEYIINAMLSSPITHGVNVGSTFLKTVSQPSDLILGGYKTRSPESINTGLLIYRYMADSLVESAKLAGASLVSGKPILTNRVGTEITTRSLTELVPKDAPLMETVIRTIGRVVDVALTVPTRLLNTEDEFFKQLNYRAYIRADLHKLGVQAELTGDDLNQFIEDGFKRSFSDSGQALNGNAAKFSAEGTFTNETSGTLKAIVDGIDAFRNSEDPTVRFFSRLAMPFVHTPAAILEDTIRLTPQIQKIAKSFQDDIHSKDPLRKSAAEGQMAIGYALTSLGIIGAMSQTITGDGPLDPAAKSALIKTGWRPNSLKVGNTYIPLNRFDPIGSVMTIPASIAEIASRDPDQAADLGKAFAIAMANNLKNKKYLTSTMLMMALLGSGTDTEEATNKLSKNFGGMVVPSGWGLLRDDPYMHEIQGGIDAMKNKTPGMSHHLPIARDAFGRKVISMNFGLWSSMKDDELTKAIVDIAKKGSHVGVLNEGIGSIDFMTMRNKAGQTAYDRLGDLMEAGKIDGQTVEEMALEIIRSPEYQGKAENPDDNLTDPIFGRDENGEKSLIPGGKAQALRHLKNWTARYYIEEYLVNEGFVLPGGKPFNMAAYLHEKDRFKQNTQGAVEEYNASPEDSDTESAPVEPPAQVYPTTMKEALQSISKEQP